MYRPLNGLKKFIIDFAWHARSRHLLKEPNSMARRFSDLNEQVFNIFASGGDPAQSNIGEVKNYWVWRTNPSNADHKLKPASKRSSGRKLDSIYITPFTITLAADTYAKLSISQRTKTAAGTTIATAAGHKAISGSESGLVVGKFQPAKVYWRNGAATTSADRISRITKETYKSYYTETDEGFSAPFGKVGTGTYQERQAAIRTAIGAGVNLITFSPEIYRG